MTYERIYTEKDLNPNLFKGFWVTSVQKQSWDVFSFVKVYFSFDKDLAEKTIKKIFTNKKEKHDTSYYHYQVKLYLLKEGKDIFVISKQNLRTFNSLRKRYKNNTAYWGAYCEGVLVPILMDGEQWNPSSLKNILLLSKFLDEKKNTKNRFGDFLAQNKRFRNFTSGNIRIPVFDFFETETQVRKIAQLLELCSQDTILQKRINRFTANDMAGLLSLALDSSVKFKKENLLEYLDNVQPIELCSDKKLYKAYEDFYQKLSENPPDNFPDVNQKVLKLINNLVLSYGFKKYEILKELRKIENISLWDFVNFMFAANANGLLMNSTTDEQKQEICLYGLKNSGKSFLAFLPAFLMEYNGPKISYGEWKTALNDNMLDSELTPKFFANLVIQNSTRKYNISKNSRFYRETFKDVV